VSVLTAEFDLDVAKKGSVKCSMKTRIDEERKEKR